MAAKKLAYDLVLRKLLGRKNKYKPKGGKTVRSSEAEGATRDPETSGSVNVSRQVEQRMRTGAEKVTRGKTSGDRGIVAESTSQGMKARAKTKVQLEKLVREKKATAAQKRQLKKMEAKDVADASRAAKTAAATRRANALKEAGKDKRDPVSAFLQDGEFIGDFIPTPRQVEQAVNNLKAKGMSAKAREIEAYKELGPKKFSQQKTKEGSKSKVRSKPKEFTSRGEELKRGGKVAKRKMGGKVSKPRGCGAAIKGYAKGPYKKKGM